MASNAVVFFAGVGTTFVILTAGFSSGLVFTKAAFDDTRAATRADPRPPPSVRVILPAYGEPAPSATTCIRPASDRGDARNARSPNSSGGSHACCTCFRAGPEDGRAKLESRAPQASGAQGEEGRCSKSQTRDEGTDPTSVKRHGLWRRRSPFLRKLANGFQSEERSVLAAIVA